MFKEVSNLNGSNSSHMIFFPRGSEFFPVLFHLHFTCVINLLQLCSFLYHQQHELTTLSSTLFCFNFTAEGPLILPSVNQSLFQMSLLNELLSSLLQVGQLYAQQGAVREAFRQFVDGLTLARHFALPYRYSL